MRASIAFLLALALSMVFPAAQTRTAKTLDIYVVDVEGGNATLFVSPSGESMLIDAGNGGAAAVRDADRIMTAVKEAGLTQIDNLIITHWHGDHFGGLAELAARIPIRNFIDHGPNVQPAAATDEFLQTTYPQLYAKAKHTVARPGHKISVAGLDVLVVTSAGEPIKAALEGAGEANPYCASFKPGENNAEDPMSVGTYVTFGRFRAIHLGDLTKNKEFELMCPNNRIGTVDVLLGLHHGVDTSNSEVLVHALRPRVAIMNNGTRKGGQPEVMKTLHASPGLEDLWQIHFSQLSGQEYTVPGMFIANVLDEPSAAMPVAPMSPPQPGPGAPPAPVHNGTAYWIKVSARTDGSFTVTNGRNNFSKTYSARFKPGTDGQSLNAAATCESLSSLTLPNTTITLAQVVPAAGFTLPTTGAAAGFSNLPAFCRIAATLRPSSDSDIRIEVWLPTSGWNGKFQAVGNGGWGGTISYPAMSEALRRGYATSSTDTGHTGPGGAFVLGHPEKFVDFAYRSEHEMTVKAKAIINAFYGSGPRLSYWNGCSTGGRQGLAEAQRFPNDYDGVIAGASANPRTRLSAWHLSLVHATLMDPARFIPPSLYPMIHQAVLDACDAMDGVRDGLISDPTRCHFDPKVLACKGENGPACLTASQVRAVSTVMSPLKNPRTGAEIFPGWEPGNELGWAAVIGGPEPTSLTVDQYRFVVFKDPHWDWKTFDVERDLAIAVKVDNGTIDAINPNLAPFAQHHGKLLMYHGWSDPLVPPRASVNYYNTVLNTMGGVEKTADWIRLFMAPGMGHCGGGEGPNNFDVITALDQWVENGKAPEQIIASRVRDGKAERTRPLCPYPQVAQYRGSGSTDDAMNFACKAP